MSCKNDYACTYFASSVLKSCNVNGEKTYKEIRYGLFATLPLSILQLVILKLSIIFPVSQFVTLINGQVLLMVNGYIFHKTVTVKNGYKWQCSAKKKKCNAFVITSTDGKTVTYSRLRHSNHKIPNYKALEFSKLIKT